MNSGRSSTCSTTGPWMALRPLYRSIGSFGVASRETTSPNGANASAVTGSGVMVKMSVSMSVTGFLSLRAGGQRRGQVAHGRGRWRGEQQVGGLARDALAE